jgi:predicted aconitase
MKLTQEETAIREGRGGPVWRKVMNTLILYGEALNAECFVDIEWGGHFSISIALPGVGPRIEMLTELVEAGLKTKHPFTLDPKAPVDFENLGLSVEQERVFREMLHHQPIYDRRMLELGLRDENAYTCVPYFPEVGNRPPPGAIMAWSESSCVVFANSVLAARTNRNSSILDLLSNIAGKTPLTGLLTDEGRRATWCIDINTRFQPPPQLLGAAIGRLVLDGVPYITGLDRFLRPELDDETVDYLKEMGAACAAIGAVGLYHVENITPEAIDHGRRLLVAGAAHGIIDDVILETLLASYPVMWEDAQAKPRKCLIGCPHLSLRELHGWACRIFEALQAEGRWQVIVETILFAAPHTIRKFQDHSKVYMKLISAGVKLSPTCPEAYMNNPLCAMEAVITNSNKLRAFTSARLLLDDELLKTIVTGRITMSPRVIVSTKGSN